MSARQPRTREELIKASNDLLYEIEMLGHVAQLLYHGTPKWKSEYWVDRTTGQALIESFCVHARALMSFFFPSSGVRLNDVIVSDFIPGWEAEKWACFDADRDRVSKEIVHLSYDRPLVRETWNYGRLCEELNQLVRQFVAQANERDVCPNFIPRAITGMSNPFGGWASQAPQSFKDASRLGERDGGNWTNPAPARSSMLQSLQSSAKTGTETAGDPGSA